MANVIICLVGFPTVISVTFFEFITVLAFIYFSNIKDLDVALIEVGMGGRLDCTNVITPVLSMLTNVALDHMQVLGDTLDKILVEKLGIVKNNVGIAIGVKDESLRNSANNYVKDHNSFVKYSSINDLTIKKCDTNLSIFDYKNIIRVKGVGFVYGYGYGCGGFGGEWIWIALVIFIVFFLFCGNNRGCGWQNQSCCCQNR